MLRISHHAIGIQQGSHLLFSAYEDGGPMWSGEGPRLHRARIEFPEPFAAAPAVHVGLTMWDIADGANQRAEVAAGRIDAQGFEVEFRTWGDTRVARVRVGWLAIGPTPHADDFEVD